MTCTGPPVRMKILKILKIRVRVKVRGKAKAKVRAMRTAMKAVGRIVVLVIVVWRLGHPRCRRPVCGSHGVVSC